MIFAGSIQVNSIIQSDNEEYLLWLPYLTTLFIQGGALIVVV